MKLSPCIEWLFADQHPNMSDRIRAAAAAGYEKAEFHLWRDKDVDACASALQETGLALTSICVDPRRSMVDPAQHDELLAALTDSIETSKKLGHVPLILASGFTRDGVSQQEHIAAAIDVLKRAATIAEKAGVLLVVEPLNDRIDHPSMFLVNTTLALDILEAVGSPHVRLLFDLYHSQVMGEDLAQVLSGRMHLIHHIQVADLPGRNEPGTGQHDWPFLLKTLTELGYDGALGLEYRPTLPTDASLAKARATLGL
ncbi:TIM barrel protein [Allorhizobium terrae]|uniref:Hydroxypyruvate isomerase n=1 Tax=Allorhizobium terrae TaxID=1848972 RepID=A0A4S3ZYT8_9HYPH|nr:TIM barrel protein [Allorhizobium terrae]THF50806.1 hydroxypyruvate isomerase [Allorhizobium terrae]